MGVTPNCGGCLDLIALVLQRFSPLLVIPTHGVDVKVTTAEHDACRPFPWCRSAFQTPRYDSSVLRAAPEGRLGAWSGEAAVKLLVAPPVSDRPFVTWTYGAGVQSPTAGHSGLDRGGREQAPQGDGESRPCPCEIDGGFLDPFLNEQQRRARACVDVDIAYLGGWPVNRRRAWKDGGNGPPAARVDADLAPSACSADDQGRSVAAQVRIFIPQGRRPAATDAVA
jgi:hypothetical protein